MRATGKLVTVMLRFGTDGVRGRVGIDLHESHITRLGTAVARAWPGIEVIIGNDGRESGEAWTNAFANGVATRHNPISSAGVAPTPAIARASQQRSCVGVAITASHNPWQDNGVKVFAPGGRKLTDEEQHRVEVFWREDQTSAPPATQVRRDARCIADYVDAVTSGLGVARFDGLGVVIDAANGATSPVIGPVTEALGLRAEIRNAAPNGRNINQACGAVHPESLAARCAERREIGIAFDGDGDRLIAVDENGSVVDGDRLIALMAVDLRKRGLLAADTVVVTSMTNLGFHRAMQQSGIGVVTTDVGDRAVLAALHDGGYVLGGEQSGHIINLLHATTGDGVLAAVQLLEIVRRSGRTLAQLASEAMQPMPQLLRNVRVTEKPNDIEALLGAELARERAALGQDGRIVVRASGTEPLVRIMVEAPTLAVAHAVAERLELLVISRT